MTRPMHAHRWWPLLALLVACRDGATTPATIAPPSAAHSLVSVAAATVASGATVELLLTTRDAQGATLRRGGRTVTFVASGGLSTGTVGAVTDRGDGTYAAPFTGVRAGAATTIGATIDGDAVTTPLPTIRVRPGAASAVTSTTSVSPRTVVGGGRAVVEVVTRDAAGNLLETGGAQVTVTASGGSGSGTLTPVTDLGDGRYRTTFTGGTPGTPLQLTTSVNGTATSAAAPTVTVARGVSVQLSQLTLSSDTVTVNAGITITLQVRDSADVPRTSGGDAVEFFVVTSGSAAAGTIGDVTDHDDGSYTAPLSATQPGGALQVGVRLNGVERRNALPAVSVRGIPTTVQQSSVAVGAHEVEAGATTTFTAQLRDLQGQPVTGQGHRVRFTLGLDGTSSGTIGPVSQREDGIFTATFTATTAGSAVTVGATVDDSSQIQMLDSLGNSHLPTLTVVSGAATAQASVLTVDPQSVNVGDSARIVLEARDAQGNALTRGGAQVSLTRSGGNGVSEGRLGALRDEGNGRYVAWYHAESAGRPDTLGATLDGVPLATGRPTITVGTACTAGPVSAGTSSLSINDTTTTPQPRQAITLPSGITTTVTLLVRDAVGCPVRRDLAVAFAIGDGGSTGTFGGTVAMGDGRFVAPFTGTVAGTRATITATVSGGAVDVAPVSVTVVPGDVSTRESQVTASQTSLAVGDSATLTLDTHDAARNALTRGGYAVTFAVTGSAAHGTVGPVMDLGNGRYTARYRATAGGGDDVIVAYIEGTPVVMRVVVTVRP